MDTLSKDRWFAVYTKRRQEQRAEVNLRRIGVGVFFPQVLRPIGLSPTKTSRIEPLFPQYLFVCCAAPSTIVVGHTRGVLRVIGTASGPTPIDDEVVDLIRNRLDGDGVIRLGPAMAPGGSVRVVAGPLRELTGVLESYTSHAERVAILLRAMNGSVRVVLESEAVELFPPAS